MGSSIFFIFIFSPALSPAFWAFLGQKSEKNK